MIDYKATEWRVVPGSIVPMNEPERPKSTLMGALTFLAIFIVLMIALGVGFKKQERVNQLHCETMQKNGYPVECK